MGATKIATCCYCGTKAALVLRGKDRHELSCGNCGAPLHAMKMLPASPERPVAVTKKAKPTKHKAARPKKRRKRKSFGKRMLSEFWDVLEDVVDEVFD